MCAYAGVGCIVPSCQGEGPLGRSATRGAALPPACPPPFPRGHAEAGAPFRRGGTHRPTPAALTSHTGIQVSKGVEGAWEAETLSIGRRTQEPKRPELSFVYVRAC